MGLCEMFLQRQKCYPRYPRHRDHQHLPRWGQRYQDIVEIAMKKPKLVVDLLTVADVCIEARARLLDSQNKGPSKKKQQEDREVNTVDHGNRINHQQQPTEQKEKSLFRQPVDAKKWCGIHRTVGHDLEECKTFLDRKKMLEKPVAQEPHRGYHRWDDPDNDDQMDEINIIFGGSMSIVSKTHGKKLKREISLTQCIEPGRRMKSSKTDISLGSKDHLETDMSNHNLPFVVKLPVGTLKTGYPRVRAPGQDRRPAPGLPRVLRTQLPLPGPGQLRGHHVSCGPSSRCPARGSSVAAT
jgi:hypothetical protein